MSTLTVDERSANLDKILNEYTLKVGVGCFKSDNAADPILNYTANDMRSLTQEECVEQSYVLHRYAGYIQKEQNRLNARIKWLTRCINLETAERLRSYGDKYTSFQERTLLAQNDKTNEYMYKLQELMMHTEVRKEELSFLSAKVTAMANTLFEQKQVKRGKSWE
jgi:hypothetical protein